MVEREQSLVNRLHQAVGAPEAAPGPAGAGVGAGSDSAAPSPSAPGVIPEVVEDGAPAGDAPGRDAWHLSLRFKPGVLQNGMDPLGFLRYLSQIGRIAHITTLPDAMPEADQMNPLDCYLGFEIELESEADKATIEHVFDFVWSDCQLRLLPPRSRAQDFVDLIHELPEGPDRLGEILVAAGALTPKELELGLAHQAKIGNAAEVPLGEILVEQGMMPAYMRGVINLRGAVVPVIDLSVRFGRPPSQVTRRSCVVIVEVETEVGQQVLGVLVDAVNEVLDIPADQIEPPPSFGARIRSEFIAGMGKVAKGFVILLAADRVLSVEELADLSSRAESPVNAGE